MVIKDNTVFFEKCDSDFVQKFGSVQAEDMVLNFSSLNNIPFIYDTYQLSAFLGTNRKLLFQYTKHPSAFYREYVVKKKNGDDRVLHSPDLRLKSFQNIILHNILEFLPVSEFATAYHKGARLKDNAAPHVGKKYLLKLDIKNFFDSICFEQVYNSAFNSKYYPKFIGILLTSLCCRNNSLPQGAPTSPAVSNLVMRNFDNNIGKWCEKHSVTYTRYCDDLTFSSDRPLHFVYNKVRSFLEETGFALNERKTLFVSNSRRQSVTGLTVNEKVSVSRDYKRSLRCEIHYILKYGFEDCLKYSLGEKTAEVSNEDLLTYCNKILGKINYVLMIEPDNVWFNSAYWKVCELAPKDKR